jgi:uncharacterized membrane protein
MNYRKRYRFRFKQWTIPMAYAVAALALAALLPRLEFHLFPQSVSTVSAPAALAICSAIASGMIALTGIVFSLTFVMVQFSATAYSPRLVLWVARDPWMSHALGVFTATFLYALTLLAWVDRDNSGKLPMVSGIVVVALLLASMGMFIAIIERVGLLQVNRMLVFTASQGRRVIDELYPSIESAATTAEPAEYRDLPVTRTLTHVGPPQVIQAVNVEALMKLATESGAVLEMAVAVGDTIVEGTPLLRVFGGRPISDERVLQRVIEVGDERTFEQDPKYAIRLVVDIAIKALSPAINDPTTAVQALDQIEDLLIRLGRRRLEIGAFRDPQGGLRLVVPFPSWDDLLRLAFDEIRSYGGDSVQVMRRMKALLENLIAVLPAERHPAVRHWEQRLKTSIARSFDDAEQQRDASVGDRQGLGISSEKPAGS